NQSDVLVQDELIPRDAAHITWAMHTAAQVSLDGAAATLTQNGQSLQARILSPPGARFELLDANPPPPQTQQPSVHRLAIRITTDRPTRIVVQFTPAGGAGHAPVPVRIEPLSRWPSDINLEHASPQQLAQKP